MKYFIILVITLFSLTACSVNEPNTSDYTPERTTHQVEVNNASSPNSVDITGTTEIEIYQYKTKIYTKTDARQNNVQLACKELNGTIVAPGEILSFCDTLGPAKPEEGYQKAETFESDGDIIQEYGGGKCQVSSTLYNAVINLSGIEIIERHEHSNNVPYVPKGQDAAVAYGSVDFKFKNNNSYSIKIVADATTDEVIIKIIKVS